MEVEFVEHPPEPGSGPPLVPAPRRPGPALDVLGVAMFAAGTALAVAAPFQRLYVVRIHDAGFSETVIGDGWGRMEVGLSDGTAGAQHAGRYGIVLVALGGLCALLALLAALALLRRLPALIHRWVIPIALVASGALATATAMMWLDAASVLDNARLVATQDARGETLAEHISVQADYGASIWLALAAAGGTLGATLLTGWSGRIRRRTPESARPPAPEPAPLPDHELGEPLTW